MADVIIKVLTPATSKAFLTVDEAKMLIGIHPGDTTEDAMVQMWIDTFSDVIATICNRTFAYETVQETWSGDLPPYDCPRLFLSHWPVADDDLESIVSAGTSLDMAGTGYVLENASGKLEIPVPAGYGCWHEPITVIYSGGYKLPDEAPPALKQALSMFVQAARLQQQRALMSGIRSISHRESRVQFYDPLAALKGGQSANAISMVADTVKDMLFHYMRFQV